MSEKLELCATCKCDKNNCRNIKVYNKGKCKIIKCLNYEKDNTKIHCYKDFDYKIKSQQCS